MVWIQNCYALVICNHGPSSPPGNSADFDFWSSQSPLKAPPCGDCSLVKPFILFSPAACFLFIYLFKEPFCLYIKQTPGISPALPWQNFGQSPAHFLGYPPPSPGDRRRGAWLQMTECISVTNQLTLKGLETRDLQRLDYNAPGNRILSKSLKIIMILNS